MKRYVQEATDENVWESIKQNTFGRNEDIKDFIEALDLIEGNAYISLDAKWGAGKTFYIRQIEETLKYLRANKMNSTSNPIDKFASYDYLEDHQINEIETKILYLPIYYNAWMYDNHNDPLMSLLLVMTKLCEGHYNSQINSGTLSNKLTSLLKALPLSIKGIDLQPLLKAVTEESGTDILKLVKTEEDTRNCVKEIFNEIIVEKAQKLIVFVDELDRCKPSFAIEMLERIKHYFDDDRIIFVVSLNKEQLIHTISKYYGSGFNSAEYLNKFFDINLNLPVISYYQSIYKLKAYDKSADMRCHFVNISNELGAYYKLSLRDILIFKCRLEDVPNRIHDHGCEPVLLSVFVPIIILLDMINAEEKRKFLDGKSEELLNKLFVELDELKKLAKRFCNNTNSDEDKFEVGKQKIINAYKCIFEYNEPRNCELEINEDFKLVCIKASNGFKF